MDTKHTPGPWSVDVDDVYTEADVKGDLICERPRELFPESRKLWENNARLIAAAPDMYEALKLAEIWLMNCTPHIEATHDRPLPLPVIRAALAKAEGK